MADGEPHVATQRCSELIRENLLVVMRVRWMVACLLDMYMYMNICLQIFFRTIKTAKKDTMRLFLELFGGLVDPGVDAVLHT